MRSLPRISLTTHGLLELLGGLALTLAALVADLGDAGTLIVFASGVTVAGLGLGAADALPLSVHQSLDNLLVVLLAAAAVGCAVAGSATAAIILLAAGAGLLAIGAGTRWSRPMRG